MSDIRNISCIIYIFNKIGFLVGQVNPGFMVGQFEILRNFADCIRQANRKLRVQEYDSSFRPVLCIKYSVRTNEIGFGTWTVKRKYFPAIPQTDGTFLFSLGPRLVRCFEDRYCVGKEQIFRRVDETEPLWYSPPKYPLAQLKPVDNSFAEVENYNYRTDKTLHLYFWTSAVLLHPLPDVDCNMLISGTDFATESEAKFDVVRLFTARHFERTDTWLNHRSRSERLYSEKYVFFKIRKRDIDSGGVRGPDKLLRSVDISEAFVVFNSRKRPFHNPILEHFPHRSEIGRDLEYHNDISHMVHYCDFRDRIFRYFAYGSVLRFP